MGTLLRRPARFADRAGVETGRAGQSGASPPLLLEQGHRSVHPGRPPRHRVHRSRFGRSALEQLGPRGVQVRRAAVQRAAVRTAPRLRLLYVGQDHWLLCTRATESGRRGAPRVRRPTATRSRLRGSPVGLGLACGRCLAGLPARRLAERFDRDDAARRAPDRLAGRGRRAAERPTVAERRVYVADADGHRLCALDATSGREAWQFTTGTRIDSPPTIFRGRALFGGRDGYVYSVTTADGTLAWRVLAARADRRFRPTANWDPFPRATAACCCGTA